MSNSTVTPIAERIARSWDGALFPAIACACEDCQERIARFQQREWVLNLALVPVDIREDGTRVHVKLLD